MAVVDGGRGEQARSVGDSEHFWRRRDELGERRAAAMTTAGIARQARPERCVPGGSVATGARPHALDQTLASTPLASLAPRGVERPDAVALLPASARRRQAAGCSSASR